MSKINAKYYEQKKTSTFYIAFAFLVLIIVITGGLYFYKGSLESQKNEIEESIQTLSGSVASIRNDPDIQIYSMYEANRQFFISLENMSQIPTFVNHFKKYFSKYDLEARGFNYSNGKVTTNLSSSTNERGFAYQKIVTFLKEYSENEAARFTSEHISSFSGHDRINYIGTFTLKK